MPTVISTDEIRARVVAIVTALLSLAIQNVMEDPEVQAAILGTAEANVKASLLLALAEVPPNEASDPAEPA